MLRVLGFRTLQLLQLLVKKQLCFIQLSTVLKGIGRKIFEGGGGNEKKNEKKQKKTQKHKRRKPLNENPKGEGPQPPAADAHDCALLIII